jgi:transcriptional antiterminator
MKAYPVKSLDEEMAFIAMHFHWSRSDLMQLEHRERRRWCREISAINRAQSGAPANPFDV